VSKNWPRLTETLTGPRAYGWCSGCGVHRPNDMRLLPGLTLWQECDENDKPELRYLWLCIDCSNKLIEPHPRLYERLHSFTPVIGAMSMCTDCVHRKGLSCAHPEARINGGPGIEIQAGSSSRAFMDGTRNGKRTGWTVTMYHSPPVSCAGRTTARLDDPIEL